MASPWQPFPLAQPTGKAQNPVYAPDLAIRLICPDCLEPHPNIVEEYSSGDLVCGSCGLVLGDRIIDDGSEWRTFKNDDAVASRSRVGKPHHTIVESSDLETTIALDDGGSGTSKELRRIATRADRNDSPSERHVSKALKDLTASCQRIELPKTILDIAKQLYQRIEQEDILPQRHRSDKAYQGTLSACILIACRQARVPRTFLEISKLTCVDKKDLANAFKVLERAFNIKPGGARAPDDPTDVGIANPEHLLVRYCNYLGLPSNIVCACRDVVKKMQGLEIGKTSKPMSVAGSAIFFASHLLGRPISIGEIANVAGMKGPAIVMLYRSLYGMKETLVPQEWIQDGRARLERLPDPSSIGK
ncbi:hypothetical protein LXA43DRAFT_1102443 [Ganoderma leucocontextum]|nr:hypothetical protein LXA43DRAFT_1102443 [Ganoderma leucocontextum]